MDSGQLYLDGRKGCIRKSLLRAGEGEMKRLAYAPAYLCRKSISRSILISPNVCCRNRYFLNVFAHPATGHGVGPEEKIRSTQDVHIL